MKNRKLVGYLIAMMLFVALMFYAHIRKKDALSKCSKQARVKRMKEQNRRKSSAIFRYHFEVDGREYSGSESTIHVDNCRFIDSLVVVYACDDPSINILVKR